MAFPTWVGRNTMSGGAAAITPQALAGTAVGDVIVIVVESANENLGNVTPTGYILAGTVSSTANATTATRVTAWWKRCTTAGEALPSIGDYGDHAVTTAFAVRGCITTGTPFIWAPSYVGAPAVNGVINFNGLTTTSDENFVVLIAVNGRDNATAHWSTTPTNTGLTSIVKQVDAGNIAGNGGGICIVTGNDATTGTLPATTMTYVATVISSVASVYMSFMPQPVLPPAVITSSAAVNNTEGSTLSHSLTADIAATWTITGGTDAQWFQITDSTLQWLNNGTKDYEAPTDANEDNIYQVQVTATNASSATTNQTITVTVTDVAGDPATYRPNILLSASGCAAGTDTLANLLYRDTGWAIATDTSTGPNISVGFPDPALPLQSGANLQSISVQARKTTANSGNPTFTITVLESGTPILTSGAYTVTSVSGEDFSFTFDSDAITNAANLTAQIIVTTAGGGPSARNSADIGLIAWVAQFNTNPPIWTTSSAISVDENAVLAHVMSSGGSSTYTIVGGADAARFEISSKTLRWLNNGTKNHEAPDDADLDNTYVVTVRATNANGTADQTHTVTVNDLDDAAPVWTSPNTSTVAENVALAHALTATDMSAITYTIVPGIDSTHFGISGSTLTWAANGVKDFENPEDADFNNIYEVVVRATDAANNFSDQTISITVSDTTVITSSNTVTIAENTTLAHTLTATEAAGGGGGDGTFSTDGTYNYWTFDANGTLDISVGGTVEYLVLGGGGGGGRALFNTGPGGGGGGAGGLLTGSTTLTAGSAAVTVGAGGLGVNTADAGLDGGNSSLIGAGANFTAIGGGGGGSPTNNIAGRNGGSGGGAAGGSVSTIPPGTGTAGQGYDGGAGIWDATSANRASGGGGGAGSIGGAGTPVGIGGNGGSGVALWGTTYAGGGGGGGGTTVGIGTDGGGNPQKAGSTKNPDADATTFGSGGGGTAASTTTFTSGNGKQGRVVIRSLVSSPFAVGAATTTWSIVGGADASQFEISGSTLRFVGNGTKNFEAPADADVNNIYVVTVRATQGTETRDQTINVTVTNVGEVAQVYTYSWGFIM